MSDQELLELAAKAAGIDHPGGDHSVHNDGRLWDCDRLAWWNPLTDDGDALRLAVKLEIQVHYSGFTGNAYVRWDRGSKTDAVYGPECSDQATRRAIVRAAAEIGKAMP